MPWLTRNRRDVATFASVVLAALAGILSNLLVGGWTWVLVTFLVVVVTALGGLEVLRRRLDEPRMPGGQRGAEMANVALIALQRNMAGESDPLGARLATQLRMRDLAGDAVLRGLATRPHDRDAMRQAQIAISRLLAEEPHLMSEAADHAVRSSVTVTGSSLNMNKSVISGGNVDQSRRTSIGTGGLGVLLLAVMLGGGAIGVGRVLEAMDQPASAPTTSVPSSVRPAPEESRPDGSATPRPSASLSSYKSSSMVVGGGAHDVDPRQVTNGLDDITFNQDVGLSLLNNARIATIPAGQALSPEVCMNKVARSEVELIGPDELKPGRTFCLRTSDGRTGTLSITRTSRDALGGFIFVSWTVWS